MSILSALRPPIYGRCDEQTGRQCDAGWDLLARLQAAAQLPPATRRALTTRTRNTGPGLVVCATQEDGTTEGQCIVDRLPVGALATVEAASERVEAATHLCGVRQYTGTGSRYRYR